MYVLWESLPQGGRGYSMQPISGREVGGRDK